MCTDYVEEKRDLIRAIPKDRKLSDLHKISQVRHFFLSVFFLFSHKGLSNAKWLIIFLSLHAAHVDNMGRAWSSIPIGTGLQIKKVHPKFDP
jgi:hypothetical protein